MMEIANEYIRVQVSAQGAELQSIVRKDNQLEYLWSGDPAFWGKKSPILFPIVGGLKDNTYRHKGHAYQLGRHGFAREMAFNVNEQTPSAITFSLSDNDDTLAKYPFPFTLAVRYAIQNATLSVKYTVQNTGDEPMYFSIGAHPAFKVPLVQGTAFDDYSLHFNRPETAGIWPLSAAGLIETAPVPYLDDVTELPLQKPMFYKDALVFKHLASDAISIRSKKTPHGLEVSYPGFPYMGIWSAKDADFVCIEPWCGIADHVDASGELAEKEGIQMLQPEAIFKREWSAIFF